MSGLKQCARAQVKLLAEQSPAVKTWARISHTTVCHRVTSPVAAFRPLLHSEASRMAAMQRGTLHNTKRNTHGKPLCDGTRAHKHQLCHPHLIIISWPSIMPVTSSVWPKGSTCLRSTASQYLPNLKTRLPGIPSRFQFTSTCKGNSSI